MKTIINSFKHILQNRDSSVTKIILLGVALAVSIVLVAKIYFENSYDGYVEQPEQIYRISPSFIQDGKGYDGYPRISCGVAGAIAEYSTGVESTTRYMFGINDFALTPIDNHKDNSVKIQCRRVVYGDSLFFDFFTRDIYGANPKEILSTPYRAMVSRSLARKISSGDGNSAIGAMVMIPRMDKPIGIYAVYEDFPENSHLNGVDMVMSLVSDFVNAPQHMDNLWGSDRFYGFVKIRDDAQLKDINSAIDKLCQEKINPIASKSRDGVTMDFRLSPITSYHREQPQIKRMTNLVWVLVASLLLAAIFNYVLISISSLVKRAKTMAVHKCYGAPKWVIYRMLILEAFSILIVSLLIAVVLIITLKPDIERLLGDSLLSLFSLDRFIYLIPIPLFILLICGIVPAYIYSNIPVYAVFRSFKENKRRWKYVLLTLQFSGAMLFTSLLVVVWLQYRLMVNYDVGYNYKNILTSKVTELDQSQRVLLAQELEKIGGVRLVAQSSTLPIYRCSGGLAYLSDYPDNLIDIVDQFSVDENYAHVFKLNIVEGRNFSSTAPVGKEVLISEKLATLLASIEGSSSGVIGEHLKVRTHSGDSVFYTICGVYDDYMIGDAISPTTLRGDKPSLLFFDKTEEPFFRDFISYVIVEVDKVDNDIIDVVNHKIAELFPDKQIRAESYSMIVESMYADSKNFRDIVFISGIVVLIITFIGLIGYLTDEINRRRSEIAIRKIHGATITQIVKLFAISVLKLILVGIVVGGISSYYLASRWLEQFSLKIDLSMWLFILGAFMVSVIAFIVVLTSTYKSANLNPVKNLHNN